MFGQRTVPSLLCDHAFRKGSETGQIYLAGFPNQYPKEFEHIFHRAAFRLYYSWLKATPGKRSLLLPFLSISLVIPLPPCLAEFMVRSNLKQEWIVKDSQEPFFPRTKPVPFCLFGFH